MSNKDTPAFPFDYTKNTNQGMTTQHTPGPLAERNGRIRRLVACWNACDGIRTEALEHRAHLLKAEDEMLAVIRHQRDELLEALEELIEIVQHAIDERSIKDMDSFTLQPARAAIAKAEGKTE